MNYVLFSSLEVHQKMMGCSFSSLAQKDKSVFVTLKFEFVLALGVRVKLFLRLLDLRSLRRKEGCGSSESFAQKQSLGGCL